MLSLQLVAVRRLIQNVDTHLLLSDNAARLLAALWLAIPDFPRSVGLQAFRTCFTVWRSNGGTEGTEGEVERCDCMPRASEAHTASMRVWQRRQGSN